MTTTPPRGGSGVSARAVSPSLHLSKLVALLVKALDGAGAGESALPLIHVDGQRVVVNTRGVLGRLFVLADWKPAFDPGEESGFVRDIDVPAAGTTARVGGRLLTGTEADTSKAIEKLLEAVTHQVEEALSPDLIQRLANTSLDEAIGALAASVSEAKPKSSQNAQMVPVAFAGNERNVADKDGDIGRMFSAIETVEGGDGLERFVQGVGNLLRNQELDDDDIDTIKESLRTRATMPGDPVQQFLRFLEDEALARVRLQVEMRLMGALASCSKSAGFKTYVDRVAQCFNVFAGPRGKSFPIDVRSVFGERSSPDLSEWLRKAGFYSCLPVWPEWAIQLFETRSAFGSQSGATVREVSYRFRVNGLNPVEGKYAFDARIDRHNRRIFDTELPDRPVARQIADLVFLWLTIPDHLDKPTEFELQARADEIAELMKRDATSATRMIIKDLQSRSKVVTQLADELVDLLTDKSHRLIAAAENTASKFRISVSRRILVEEAFSSYGDKSEVLRRSQSGSDNIEWLKYLTVGEDEVIPGSLLSFVVNTDLKERSLVVVGEPTTLTMKRQLDQPALPVRLSPYRWLKAEATSIPLQGTEGVLDAGTGIEVQYDLKVLKRDGNLKNADKAGHEQRRAAAITAFSLLAYITLWVLHKKVKEGQPEVATLLLRVAPNGKLTDRGADSHDPSSALYAVSQALEKAMAREGSVKLQGLTTSGDQWTFGWRKKGALSALTGGQKLSFDLQGSAEKVALVTYVTRPCDDHPSSIEPDDYLFMCRTYRAHRQGNGATIEVARMRSRIMGSKSDFKNPQPILEELAWLDAQGYQHVMLLSHHFGNRHIGRAAERHAPHGTLEFLDEAHRRFPNMRFYTLRRDVFPATRLRRRKSSESAFEVLKFEDHQDLYDQHARDALRGVMPVYTFATLNVVGDSDSRPQSGFCTYFADLEQRMSDVAASKAAEADILGFGSGGEIRKSLICVLRAVHFLESEKPGSAGGVLQPVLDPFDWATPLQRASMGEIEIMNRQRKGEVFLSLPAVLSHVTKVLHREVDK